MQALLQIILLTSIILTSIGTLYHSIVSRRAERIGKGMARARMNMNMGILFLSIGTMQLTLSGGYWLRYVLIGLIFLIGLVNLYAGARRLRYFKQQVSQGEGQ